MGGIMTTKNNPTRLAPGRGLLNNSQQHHTPHKCLPPYSGQIDPALENSFIVFTGRNGWNQAKIARPIGRALVLPFGADPASFHWPMDGRDCIIQSFGEREPYSRLAALAIELVRAGATFAIFGYGAHDQSGPAPIFRAGGVS